MPVLVDYPLGNCLPFFFTGACLSPPWSNVSMPGTPTAPQMPQGQMPQGQMPPRTGPTRTGCPQGQMPQGQMPQTVPGAMQMQMPQAGQTAQNAAGAAGRAGDDHRQPHGRDPQRPPTGAAEQQQRERRRGDEALRRRWPELGDGLLGPDRPGHPAPRSTGRRPPTPPTPRRRGCAVRRQPGQPDPRQPEADRGAVAQLRSGLWYVDFGTANHPGGEIPPQVTAADGRRRQRLATSSASPAASTAPRARATAALAAAALARLLLRPPSVRLRVPPPLDHRELKVEATADEARLFDGDTLSSYLRRAAPTSSSCRPRRRHLADADTALKPCAAWFRHPLPHCFVCRLAPRRRRRPAHLSRADEGRGRAHPPLGAACVAGRQIFRLRRAQIPVGGAGLRRSLRRGGGSRAAGHPRRVQRRIDALCDRRARGRRGLAFSAATAASASPAPRSSWRRACRSRAPGDLDRDHGPSGRGPPPAFARSSSRSRSTRRCTLPVVVIGSASMNSISFGYS